MTAPTDAQIFDSAMRDAYDGHPSMLIAYLYSANRPLTEQNRDKIAQFLDLLYSSFGGKQ